MEKMEKRVRELKFGRNLTERNGEPGEGRGM